jgi:hypothetical protein
MSDGELSCRHPFPGFHGLLGDHCHLYFMKITKWTFSDARPRGHGGDFFIPAQAGIHEEV